MHSVYHMLAQRKNNSLKHEIVLEPDNPCNLQVLETYFQKIIDNLLKRNWVNHLSSISLPLLTFYFTIFIYDNEIMIISDLAILFILFNLKKKFKIKLFFIFFFQTSSVFWKITLITIKVILPSIKDPLEFRSFASIYDQSKNFVQEINSLKKWYFVS